MTQPITLPYKVSVLVFLKNDDDQFLLLKRTKSPNKDCWTPIGGKVHMDEGESPFECAVRETKEETGLDVTNNDLHLFSMIAEKGYEDQNHWLLFLFTCSKPINTLPPSISEGHFQFYSRNEIDTLDIPKTDKQALWSIYDNHNKGFVALKANCYSSDNLQISIEESH